MEKGTPALGETCCQSSYGFGEPAVIELMPY